MKEDKRFQIKYSQGTLEVYRVIVDKETGVNYLYIWNGHSAGLTVMLNSEGKPLITEVEK